MSLSVRVLASSASGSRARSRKYGDFTRAASTRLAMWRSVIASTASGSSQGSQSSWARVKTVGTVWAGGTRTLSLMSAPRASGTAGQGAQPRDHPDLEGQEGDDLRERHDVGRAPAGVQQRLQGRGLGIARVEDQHVDVLECRGEVRAERPADRGSQAIAQAGRVLPDQRPGVARVEDENVDVLECCGEGRAERPADRGSHAIAQAGRIFAAQRSGRI